MNQQHPVQTDKQDPAKDKEKRNLFSQGWIWLIMAVIGIGVVFFGFSGLTEQMTQVNQSIQENTQAIQEQSHLFSDMNQNIQQLIIAIKDSVNDILQSI